MRIAVIGTEAANERELETARAVGEAIGRRGHDLVCGGRGGVMAAAAAGARAEGAATVGILPGPDRSEANPHLDVAIATNLGNMRNELVVRNGDGVVAVGGRYGTLSEIAFALDLGRPVAGIATHDVEGVEHVEGATAALDAVEAAVDQ
ncbi:MAG: TIGR00725 family protein [Halobacteriales archaeon]